MRNRGADSRHPGWAAIVTVLLAFAGARWAAAQTPSSVAPLTFHADTQVVLVPVDVRDRSGRIIANLKPSDFRLEVGGAPMPIAALDHFQAHSTSGPSPSVDESASTLPANSFTNQASGPRGSNNLVILLLDFLNTTLADRIVLRQQLLSFLAHRLKNGQEIGIYGLGSRLALLQPFSRDAGPLIATAQRLLRQKDAPPAPKSFVSVVPAEVAGTAPNAASLTGTVFTAPAPPAGTPAQQGESQPKYAGSDQATEFMQAKGDWQANNFRQHSRAAETLAQLRELAQAFAGVPGRKSVIWLTGDISPLNPSMMYMTVLHDPSMATLRTPEWQVAETFDALNAASMTLIPVDVRGVVNTGLAEADHSLSHSEFMQTIAESQPNDESPYSGAVDLREGETANAKLAMLTAAHETGGTVLEGSNDLGKLLAHAQALWSDYYVISFHPPPLAPDAPPRYHRITVHVNVPGARVHARQGYADRPSGMLASAQEEVRDFREAVQSPVDLTALPLRLDSNGIERRGKLLALPFGLTVRRDALTPRAAADGFEYNVSFLTVVRDRHGKLVGHAERHFHEVLNAAQAARLERTGLTYAGRFEAPAGDIYFGRVIVRNNLTGTMGSITLELPWE
ncbi:MAG: VWA domain-containing protein [Terriglobales bacterium]